MFVIIRCSFLAIRLEARNMFAIDMWPMRF